VAQSWQTVEVATTRRVEVRDITDLAVEACPLEKAPDGLLVVICPHTTAGLCLNEAESGLMSDIEAWLERLVPSTGLFAHNAVDTNADAHLRAIVLGHSVCVPVIRGTLGTGRWQRILLVECDGPRKRHLWAKIVGG